MTETTPRQPFMDGRHFKLNENEAHVWRVVDPRSGEAKGVQLTISFGWHATAPREYLTGDLGETFAKASFDGDGGCLKITKIGIETEAEKLETLNNAYTTWKAASGRGYTRELIRRRSE